MFLIIILFLGKMFRSNYVRWTSEIADWLFNQNYLCYVSCLLWRFRNKKSKFKFFWKKKIILLPWIKIYQLIEEKMF